MGNRTTCDDADPRSEEFVKMAREIQQNGNQTGIQMQKCNQFMIGSNHSPLLRSGIHTSNMNIGALSNPSYDKQQAEFAGARRLCQDQSNLASPMDFMSILQNNIENGSGLMGSGHFRQPKHTKNSILGSSGSDMKLNEFAGGLKNHMTTSRIPSKFESNKKSEQEGFDCQNEYCQDIRNESFRFADQDQGSCT